MSLKTSENYHYFQKYLDEKKPASQRTSSMRVPPTKEHKQETRQRLARLAKKHDLTTLETLIQRAFEEGGTSPLNREFNRLAQDRGYKDPTDLIQDVEPVMARKHMHKTTKTSRY